MGNVGGVKEQSHKSEMGAALRGDFERLRARRGAVGTLVEPPAPTPPEAAEPSPEPHPQPQPAAAPAAESAGGGSWLSRLRGRA